MSVVFISKSTRMTRRAAELFADEIRRYAAGGSQDSALVIALSGELGAGKTTFSKALGKALGVRAPMHSPTFVLMKRYPIRVGSFSNVWHADLYRIDSIRELDTIGFREILRDPKNIVLVEWADKARSVLKRTRSLRITFTHKSLREREIAFG